MEPGMEHPTQDPRDKTIRDLKTDHAGFEYILITRTLLKHRSEQSQSGTFFSLKSFYLMYFCAIQFLMERFVSQNRKRVNGRTLENWLFANSMRNVDLRTHPSHSSHVLLKEEKD